LRFLRLTGCVVESPADRAPAPTRTIKVRVTELRQLFSSIDPSPFRERDLDPRAEEFIVEWAKDLGGGAPLSLVVHLERSPGEQDELPVLRDAIHEFFTQRAAVSRRNLRALFRRGRISLGIALAFLALSIFTGDIVSGYVADTRVGEVVREGLLIGGWVAMWRPLEVFLYDWWPLRAEARLYDVLAHMPIAIEYAGSRAPDAWRHDWPAVGVAARPSH
jgi:hypothetical protein